MRGYLLLSLLLSAQYALGQNPQIFSTLQLRYGENSRIEYEQKMDIYKVRVSKNSNYYHGICDNNGKEIISPEYDIVYTHYDNFFVMNKDGKAGAARRDGTIILPCRYTNISPKDDFLVVAKGPVVGKTLQYGWDVYSQLGAYNLNGEEIIPCRYSNIVYSLGNYIEVCNGNVLGKDATGSDYYSGPFGIYSKDGKEVLPCIYDNPVICYQTALDDYFIVCKGGTVQPDYSVKGGKWGLVNKDNEIIIPFEYDAISRPSENVSSVCIGGEKVFQPYPPKEYHGGKWGLFSLLSKKEIVPPTYDYILSFKNGLVQVKQNGVTSLVDVTMQLPNSNPGYHSDVDFDIPSTSQISENTFAFILTAEKLPGGRIATAANNDGEVFKKYLENTMGVPSKNILFYKDGTFGQFHSMIKRITDISDVYESDANIIVYLSGVGIVDVTPKDRLFFPTDVSYDNIQSTAISINEICNALRDLESTCTIIVDSPFDGKDREGNNLLSGRGVIVSQNSIPVRDGLTILLSANNSGRSILSEDGAHGLMTYVLLKQIRISHSLDKTLLNQVVNETAKINRGVDIVKPTLYE